MYPIIETSRQIIIAEYAKIFLSNPYLKVFWIRKKYVEEIHNTMSSIVNYIPHKLFGIA